MLAAFVVDKLTGTNLGTVHSGVEDNFVCFCSTDDDIRPADVGSYPVPVPQVGATGWSYENALRLRCISAPNNNVSGIKIYGPLTQPGSGLTVYMGLTSSTAYTPQNTGIVRATTIQHANYYDNLSNYLTWNISGSATNKILGVGAVTDILWTQLRVDPEASGNTGTMNLFTLTLEYDES